MPKILPTTIVQGCGVASTPPVAFHPVDGWIVTTGVQANQITSIDCHSGKPRHCGRIAPGTSALSFGKSGESLIVIGDNEVSCWAWQGHGLLECIGQAATPLELPEDGVVPLLATDNDCVWIFGDEEWLLWSMRTCDRLDSLAIAVGERVIWVGHDLSGNSLALVYDEELVNHPATTLSIVNLQSRKVQGTITLDEWNEVLVSLDGKLAVLQAQQSDSKKADVWDLEQYSLLHSISHLRLGVRPRFAGDNRHIITPPVDNSANSLQVTDVLSQSRKVWETQFPLPPNVVPLPQSDILAIFANDRRHPIDCTKFWKITTNSVVAESAGHLGHALFSPCGKWFASVSSEASEQTAVQQQPGGTVRITNLNELRNLQKGLR